MTNVASGSADPMHVTSDRASASPTLRPVKIGLMLPQIEGAMGGKTARWADLVAIAQRAEALGFDSLWVIDHLLMYPGQPGLSKGLGLWECWSLVAALAAVTKRVELGPLVSSTSFRNPALLAKTADTVDEISDGRLVLGLGAGSYEAEHHAFGYPFDHRVGRFEEAITIIRTLLQKGRTDFEGTYYGVHECELRPRSLREGGPPILVGTLAHRERMLRLVAHHADMWNVWLAYGRSNADQIPPLSAAVDAACTKVGRDPQTLHRSACVLVDVSSRLGGDAFERIVPPRLRSKNSLQPLAGSTEELAEALRTFAREGVTHVQVLLFPTTIAGIEAFAPVLQLLDRETANEFGTHRR
jgi:alkanesulfonate monooxygenase SsuD/methylene tetrahydromethanopterin reductase-like flavin-dependent oxidoreductase (luciferase family)